MNSTTVLIFFAALMWLLHTIFGWFQIIAFNRAFIQISKKGKIISGKSSGRFGPQSIIILALDENKKVVDSLQMKGFSMFARPKRLPDIIGLHLEDIHPHRLFPNDKKSQFALELAISALK